jgi:hypothetical protein
MSLKALCPQMPRLVAHAGADFAIYDMEHGASR